MDRETDQHKWKFQLTASFDNYLMGNKSLYECGYRVPQLDESQTLPVEIKTTSFIPKWNLCHLKNVTAALVKSSLVIIERLAFRRFLFKLTEDVNQRETPRSLERFNVSWSGLEISRTTRLIVPVMSQIRCISVEKDLTRAKIINNDAYGPHHIIIVPIITVTHTLSEH